jgi:hypothetical protein
MRDDPKCSYCGHLKSNHDTGWDAAGCMVAMCHCQSFRDDLHCAPYIKDGYSSAGDPE